MPISGPVKWQRAVVTGWSAACTPHHGPALHFCTGNALFHWCCMRVNHYWSKTNGTVAVMFHFTCNTIRCKSEDMMHPPGKMFQYWSVTGNNKQNMYFVVGYSNQYCTSNIIKIDHVKESICPKKNKTSKIVKCRLHFIFFILKTPKTVKIALN